MKILAAPFSCWFDMKVIVGLFCCRGVFPVPAVGAGCAGSGRAVPAVPGLEPALKFQGCALSAGAPLNPQGMGLESSVSPSEPGSGGGTRSEALCK